MIFISNKNKCLRFIQYNKSLLSCKIFLNFNIYIVFVYKGK